MSELEQAAEEFRQRWTFDPRPVIERDFRVGDFGLGGGTAYERSFMRAMLTGAKEGPMMPIPECDRVKYGDMNEVLYWEMVEAARTRMTGLSGRPTVSVTPTRWRAPSAANGCGLAYRDISAGKVRECGARQKPRR